MIKTLIIGNAGSGKSTLAKTCADAAQVPHLDLDTFAWKPDQPGVREETAVSLAKLHTFIDANPHWVIEGCYASLIHAASEFCSELVFLNPGTGVCMENCKSRPWESHKYKTAEEQDKNLAMLLDWVAEYAGRDDEYSLSAHRAVFAAYQGKKTELTSNQASRDKADQCRAQYASLNMLA